MTVQGILSRKVVVFILGLLLGCGCMVGIGAAKSQQASDLKINKYFEDTPEFAVICLAGVSYAAIVVERGGKTSAMGFSVMLTPLGTPLPCMEE